MNKQSSNKVVTQFNILLSLLMLCKKDKQDIPSQKEEPQNSSSKTKSKPTNQILK